MAIEAMAVRRPESVQDRSSFQEQMKEEYSAQLRVKEIAQETGVIEPDIC